MTTEYQKHIKHFSKLQIDKSIGGDSENMISVIDADYGRDIGFERVAVHHITVPPNRRTSAPHAESDEEELVC